MRTEVSALANEHFDLLVIGGGVLGAGVARDAALRGLRTALVEADDFAAGTSANSLKIVHGGLRYLQSLDLRRMRDSIRERSMWLRTAPHLVEPLPVLMPTYRRSKHPRALLRLALAVNDAISADRNRGLDPDRVLRCGRALSPDRCLEMVPELAPPGLTGGVLFHDAQMYSSERLVLEMVLSARTAGAVTINHARCDSPLHVGGRMAGARVNDRLSGETVDVRARVVVNAAGHSAPALAGRLTGRGGTSGGTTFSVAMNLMVAGLGHRSAFTLTGRPVDPHTGERRGERQLFVVPWRGRTMIGTAHFPYHGNPANFRPDERHVAAFLTEFNDAWSGTPVGRDDVVRVHAGLLPAGGGGRGGMVGLLTRPRIMDHAEDGVPGVITAVSVKYTTGRRVAEDVVTMVCGKLGIRRAECRTASEPLPGAPPGSVEMLLAEARRGNPDLEPEVLEHLVRTYGTVYTRVLGCREGATDVEERVVPGTSVIRAQFVHAVRHELACTPEDIVHRRTELGATGMDTEGALDVAAEVIAKEGRR